MQDLRQGGNAQYTSERFKQEIVQALAECVPKPIFGKLRDSPFFSLCIDETTDVSITKQLIVYGRYIVDGAVQTSFLRALELPNGQARTITDAVCSLCADLEVDLKHRLCGLGSDGASVMLGVRGGVSTLLKNEVLRPLNNILKNFARASARISYFLHTPICLQIFLGRTLLKHIIVHTFQVIQVIVPAHVHCFLIVTNIATL